MCSTGTDNGAMFAGYVVEYIAYSDDGDHDLHISVKEGTELNGRFRAFCHDEQEYIIVNGWLYTFEPCN